MLYQLLNALCGWDYIAWRNTADRGVARLHKDAMGNTFYWRYKNIKLFEVIRTKDQVIWLTCDPDKYLNPVEYGLKLERARSEAESVERMTAARAKDDARLEKGDAR